VNKSEWHCSNYDAFPGAAAANKGVSPGFVGSGLEAGDVRPRRTHANAKPEPRPLSRCDQQGAATFEKPQQGTPTLVLP
jgi:hypothetical protein